MRKQEGGVSYSNIFSNIDQNKCKNLVFNKSWHFRLVVRYSTMVLRAVGWSLGKYVFVALITIHKMKCKVFLDA